MGEVFFKALRWFLFVVFIMGGIWGIKQVEIRGMEFAMLAVLSFGGAYLMSGPWRDLPPTPMVVSVAAAGAFAFAAQYIPHNALYIYLGVPFYLNFYTAWALMTFVFGVPLMMFVFKKYDT